jgi:hypothetical protein
VNTRQHMMDAARNMAEAYSGGGGALAKRFEKNPTTFLHELNETGMAKLGLVDAVTASKRAKDLRVLNAFAEEMGCMVTLVPESLIVGDDDALHLVSRLAGEFNDTVRAFVDAVADGSVSANEISEIHRQWGELQAVGQRLLSHASSLHEASKPARLKIAGQD